MILLRPATINDANDLLEWRNDPLTRENSNDQNVVKFESHLNWLKNVLKKPNDHIFIAETLQEESVGTARVNWNGKHFELSWTVSPKFREKGIGKQIASIVVNQFFPSMAEVKINNISCRKILENVGLHLVEEKGDFAYYKMEYPKKYRLDYKEKLKIIDEIEQTRTKNNVNWMDLLRLAFTEAPDKAVKIFRKINSDDNKISELFKKLGE